MEPVRNSHSQSRDAVEPLPSRSSAASSPAIVCPQPTVVVRPRSSAVDAGVGSVEFAVRRRERHSAVSVHPQNLVGSISRFKDYGSRFGADLEQRNRRSPPSFYFYFILCI
ncbi:hypothetical protein AAHA92_09857 [Salvia divinorum]|uniref:Uncharacterized protein n=1 Tax=Salvia divinorum TaxID=28513 RepID=A0ABD1HSS4_SALDI